LREALAAEEQRLDGEWDKLVRDEHYHSPHVRHFSYKYRGVYIEQLQRYEAWIDRSRIMVIASEQFFEDPERILRDVWRFLDVDEDYLPGKLNARGVGSYTRRDPIVYEELQAHFRPYNARLYEHVGEDFGW